MLDAGGSLAERFYRAFLDADLPRLEALVAPDAVLVIRAPSLLAGSHPGPRGLATLRHRVGELTGMTWGPLREDSHDVATSDWHAVVMDRFVAERGDRRLDSHEALVLAIEEDRIVRLFHYVHDPVAFTGFWS
ncbi:MAG: nuclear transport factor 2 family protein [Gaiellaceae bacterium]